MAVVDHPIAALREPALACAERLHDAESVLLASHIDADGLTSAAVASTALARASIDHEVVFEKQLDADAIAGIAARDHEVVLFTDFGSGQLEDIHTHATRGDFVPIIADHHQPADAETPYHLNPLLEGIDGASELSGAGTAYALARALEGSATDNRDLAALAVVGAVGDMQDGGGGLVGANEAIVTDGVDAGVLETQPDLDLYGRQTRPLPKLLEYASDVRIPGISGDEAGAIAFLHDIDVEVTDADGEWRRWVDLDSTERQTLVSALIRRAVASGVPAERVNALVGTSYTLLEETVGTALRDVSEFSTLLNATARYERADVGLAVCLGDRDAALAEAHRLLQNHRRNLSEGLQWVKNEGVKTESQLQWFDAGSHIRETIVGIVAGMAAGSSAVDRSKPVIAFAVASATELKVSARATGALVRRGLDLSVVMREASRAVEGDGGGHDIAAGATIPADARDAFLERADSLIADQLGA